MARYDIQSYDDYVQILALYRNTRAFEAQNARQRFTELSEACAAVEGARLSVIQTLRDRYPNP